MEYKKTQQEWVIPDISKRMISNTEFRVTKKGLKLNELEDDEYAEVWIHTEQISHT